MNSTTNPSWLQDKSDLVLSTLRSQQSGNWIDRDCIRRWKRLKFSFSNEVLYCRLLITNNKEHCIDRTSSHILVQSKWLNIVNPQGQYHETMSIIRSSTRSKRTKWYSRVPLTPHQGTYIFPINFHDVVSYFGNFRQSLIQMNGSIMSRSKDFKFWTLADR